MNEAVLVDGKWTDMAGHLLGQAVDEDYSIDCLRKDVEQGACSLFYITTGEVIGAAVLRLEQHTNHSELVVVAAGGYLKGGSLFKVITDYAKGISKVNNVKCIRAHCKTESRARLMRMAGGELSEYVYRLEV